MGNTRVQTTSNANATEAEKLGQERRVKSKKIKAKVAHGKCYVKSTYNNTIVSISDLKGNILAWGSAGVLGFKGPKRATPYAATEVVKYLLERVRDCDIRDMDVFVRGIGGGREAAVRALATQGINILSIKDVTPIPHNGPRPPKVRRV